MSEKNTDLIETRQELPSEALAPRPVRSIELLPDSQAYSTELLELVDAYRGACPHPALPKHDKAMSFANLEMLEAELTNQRLLPVLNENVPSLSQAAIFESNLLQWRARRMGVDGARLEFQIQLADYIGYLGAELIQLLREMKLSPAHLLRGTLTTKRISWRAIFPSEEIVRAMLSYLDRFARYLFSERDALENRYQRGLNLVLKVIAASSADVAPSKPDAIAIQVALPVAMRDYLARLRLQAPR